MKKYLKSELESLDLINFVIQFDCWRNVACNSTHRYPDAENTNHKYVQNANHQFGAAVVRICKTCSSDFSERFHKKAFVYSQKFDDGTVAYWFDARPMFNAVKESMGWRGVNVLSADFFSELRDAGVQFRKNTPILDKKRTHMAYISPSCFAKICQAIDVD